MIIVIDDITSNVTYLDFGFQVGQLFRLFGQVELCPVCSFGLTDQLRFQLLHLQSVVLYLLSQRTQLLCLLKQENNQTYIHICFQTFDARF